jgi:SAM-dependent methyltransferase
MPSTTEEIYARKVHYYLQTDLAPSERVLLDRIGTAWGSLEMLDIGVGAGRTSYTFGALCRRYVGIDFVPSMIELCRERVGETARCSFAVADAREMPQFRDGEFDLALFSFNGLDSLGHDDRILVLREVRRVLRPGGIFFFSAHSLNVFPFRLTWPDVSWRRPVRALRFRQGALRRWLRLRMANRAIDPAEARRRGWSRLIDDGHDFEMAVYYATPDEQLRQIRDAGFTVDAVLDRAGHEVREPSRSPEHWLHYLCRAGTSEGLFAATV